MNRNRVRSLAALTAVALVSIAAPGSFAAGFGHGTFKGRVVGPKSGSSADVAVKVKKKVSATATLHMNDCTGSGTGITDIPVSTENAKINKGPAGGGFAIDQTIKTTTSAGPAEIELSIVGGIRQKTVQATFDAYVSSPNFGSEINCSLSGNLKAKKK
jgi:hypothetical protein